MEMKAHHWGEAAGVAVDMVVLTEVMVRMGAVAEEGAEPSVGVAAAATIGDSIEAVEVDHEDEEPWGRSSKQAGALDEHMHDDVLLCKSERNEEKKKLVHVLVTERHRRLEPRGVHSTSQN